MKRLLILTVLMSLTIHFSSFALDMRIGATVNYDKSAGTTLLPSVTDNNLDPYALEYVAGKGLSLYTQLDFLSNGVHTLGTQILLEANIYNGVRYKDLPYNDNTLELPILINYTHTTNSVLDEGIGIGPYVSYQIQHNTLNLGACLSLYTAILQGANGHVKLFARFYNDFTNNSDYTRRFIMFGVGFDYKIFDNKSKNNTN